MHYFIHIPKTAGTSFRVAAEAHFGRTRIVYDYGDQSPVTSDSVRQYLHEQDKPDRAALIEHCRKHNMALLAGHTALDRYAQHLGLPQSFTFLRAPLARCFSEYLHVQREDRFSGSFRDYFTNKRQINRQLKALSGMPLQALGAVGVTERYRDSLKLLNRHYGWHIAHRKVNQAGWFAPKLKGVSVDDQAEFNALNAKDLALYECACQLLDQRLAMQQSGQPFVHGGHQQDKKGRISGWAWWANKDAEQPVEVALWQGNQQLEVCRADRPAKAFKGYTADNEAAVGFAFEQAMEPTDNDWQVRVVATGQLLWPHTY